MEKKHLSYADVDALARERAQELGHWTFGQPHLDALAVYAVPRGGIPATYALGQHLKLKLVNDPARADFIFDDIIATGDTRQRYKKHCKPFHALIEAKAGDPWVVFPWEVSADGADHSVTDNFTRILQYIGEDPTREGLKETPQRMAKAWKELCSGYGKDPMEVLKVFEDGAAAYDEMVVVKAIPFHSVCEHHMLPFSGKAAVAYVPAGRIVGLSKIYRLVDIFARRLQVQERLTTQIADAIQRALLPKGVAVYLQAEHFCMACRGIGQDGIQTCTSALRGCLHEGPARAEFLQIIKP